MSTAHILQQLDTLSDRLRASIYSPGFHKYREPEEAWEVNLTYEHEDTKLEVIGKGPTFEVALAAAYNRVERVITTGLGRSAMQPALEYHKTANMASTPPFPPDTCSDCGGVNGQHKSFCKDEIPF